MERRTLQPTIDPNSNARSGIPVPASVKKPSATGRMSIAGPALRAPQPPPSIPRQSIMPGSNPRQSIMRSQNLPPNSLLLQSASKQNFARTPLNNSTRRGSVWGAGSSAQIPPSSQTFKDPRPLRDKPFQSQMKLDVYNYLRSIGYEIAQSTLSNIQGKDYRAIFDCLVGILDPNFPLNPQVRFEEEFVPVLKALHYPFVNAIDNKALAAPASMHAWPTLLGVLHWLVESCKAVTAYETSGDPTLQVTSDIPEEFEDPWDHQALAFDYFVQAYGMWLDMMADDFVEPTQNLEDRYARKNEQAQTDLDDKVRRLEEATIELDKLKSTAPPIAQLQSEIQMLNGDGDKFQRILAQYNARKKRTLDQITSEKAQLVTQGQHLEHLREEQRRLEVTVKAQNLSPEEVIKMNSDHETLEQTLKDLQQKMAETSRNVMTLEVNVANRATSAEEAIDIYTHLLATLDLYPAPSAPLPTTPLTLELNTASPNPQQLLIGDIRGAIKPCLSMVAESKRAERATVESERIKFDDDLDRLTMECENIEEEMAQVEKKVVGLNDQADDLREVAQQEATVANSDATRLERELANAKTAALANGMGVKSRLQALQFQYREQMEKVSRLKDETVRAIIKNSTDITNFKATLSQHLAELAAAAKADE